MLRGEYNWQLTMTMAKLYNQHYQCIRDEYKCVSKFDFSNAFLNSNVICYVCKVKFAKGEALAHSLTAEH